MSEKKMQAWYDQNPLQLWQIKTGTTNQTLAARVGVSLESVRRWKRGVTQPSAEYLDSLAILTQQHNLAALWDRWLDDMPMI